MILALDPKAQTLTISDLTDQDLSALAVLAVGDKEVSKVETVLANMIREFTENQRVADIGLILDSAKALPDDKRKAIVDIITGKVAIP
jgi:hypothetical protein